MANNLYRKNKGMVSESPEYLYQKDRGVLVEPFHFPGTNGKAVLLIHGWTSVPYEVRRLGSYLNEKGYTVLGPVLRGHGTRPEDLAGVKWEEWLEDTIAAYQELKKNHTKVYVVGTSMGANLAVMIAKNKPEISGLVLMAMPYNFKMEWTVFFVKILSWFRTYNKKYYPPSFGKSEIITRCISYQIYPIKSVLEVFRLVKKVRETLPSITQPCLMIQSTSDHIVAKGNLEKIFLAIGSKNKQKKYIQKAYHTFISDIKNKYVFEDILSFLEEN